MERCICTKFGKASLWKLFSQLIGLKNMASWLLYRNPNIYHFSSIGRFYVRKWIGLWILLCRSIWLDRWWNSGFRCSIFLCNNRNRHFLILLSYLCIFIRNWHISQALACLPARCTLLYAFKDILIQEDSNPNIYL
jgi:hypothetical protein